MPPLRGFYILHINHSTVISPLRGSALTLCVLDSLEKGKRKKVKGKRVKKLKVRQRIEELKTDNKIIIRENPLHQRHLCTIF